MPANASTVRAFIDEFSPIIGPEGVRPLLRAVRRAHLVMGLADPTCRAHAVAGSDVPPKILTRISLLKPAIASTPEEENDNA
jgi:hypothetical protein